MIPAKIPTVTGEAINTEPKSKAVADMVNEVAIINNDPKTQCIVAILCKDFKNFDNYY